MLKDITIGQYYPVDSLVHRLDPRTKINVAIIYIISIFMVKGYLGYGVVLLFMLGAISISRVPLKLIIKGLRPLKSILVFTFLINVFLTKGTPLISIFSLTIHKEGVDQALFMAFRLILLIGGTSLLTLCTSPIALTDGIEKLLNPLKKIKVPAHELAMMMTIALRFIPTLLEETDKIMKAQKARGADFESGNLINRAKNLIPILVPLFISAFRRADELAMAMEARCYRGGDNRTKMKVLRYTKEDLYGYGSAFMLLLVMIGVRYI